MTLPYPKNEHYPNLTLTLTLPSLIFFPTLSYPTLPYLTPPYPDLQCHCEGQFERLRKGPGRIRLRISDLFRGAVRHLPLFQRATGGGGRGH